MAAGTGTWVMAGEGEHAGPALQRDMGGRGPGEAVRARSPALRRVRYPTQLEAAAGEPVAESPAPGPAPTGHGSTPPCRRARAAGCSSRSCAARRRRSCCRTPRRPAPGRPAPFRRSDRSVPRRRPPPRPAAGPRPWPRRAPRRRCADRVRPDGPTRHHGGDGGPGRRSGHAPGPRRADRAQRTGWRRVQCRPDLVLDRGQPPGECGAGLVVIVVPRVPVPSGHTRYATDVTGAAAPRDNCLVGPGGSGGGGRHGGRGESEGSGGLERLALTVRVPAGPRHRPDPPASRRKQNLLDMVAAGS